MLTSIWSIGITPLSTPMSTRGKLVEGKTAMAESSARVSANRRQHDDQGEHGLRIACHPKMNLPCETLRPHSWNWLL